MDLDPIGKHCALQSCNVLDFLPIQCSCSQWFCKLHISPDLHDCPSVQQHPFESSSSTGVRPKCAFSACNKTSLGTGVTAVDLTQEGEPREAIPRGCPGCQLSFCVDHRHMQSHACPGLVIGKDDVKHEAARAILAEKFLATGNSTSYTPVVARRPRNLPPDSQKLAQLRKVNLMKLRHKAVPGDPKDKGSSIPVDQRIHVTVRLGQSTKEIVLWFRKTTITGKALDLAVQHFGVSHTTFILHLEQSSAEIGSHVLQNHLELSGQLEDGSTVVLTDSRSNG